MDDIELTVKQSGYISMDKVLEKVNVSPSNKEKLILASKLKYMETIEVSYRHFSNTVATYLEYKEE